MAHIHDPAPRAVYGIVDQDSHTVYIGKSYPHRMRKTYSEHIHGRVRKTRELFAISDTPPQLYILKEAEMTTAVVFRYCVAWTRYFLDHGYTQFFSDILTDYAVDMIPETQRIYESICNLPIEEVLSPDKMVTLPKRNSAQERQSDCVQLSIRFTPQEYAKVITVAKEHNFPSTTAYCKHMAISGRVIELDLSLISEQIAHYRDIKTLLRQILLSIHKTGKYYPADMCNIQDCIDRMDKYLKEVLDMSTNLIHTLRRDGYDDISAS